MSANTDAPPFDLSPLAWEVTKQGNTETSTDNGGHYLLGQGYRAFNPVLMRFNSPDSFSPFGKEGLNSYSYCVGDPINFKDPVGH